MELRSGPTAASPKNWKRWRCCRAAA
jgi:hypothetical protein